jgi:hypothetical protein
MAGEIIASLTIFKTLLDSAKSLKNINDATIRNAAIVELQEKILSAQEQQAALVERLRTLEKEVADHETWEREKERYQLTDHGCSTFTYSLKQEAANNEPHHRICSHCYQNRRKSVLQSHGRFSGGREKVSCPSCKETVLLGCERDRQTHAISSGSPWSA